MATNAYRTPRPIGYQQIVGMVAATNLTVPTGTSFAIIQPESQAVRWRDDGVAPTASVGYPLAVGAELRYDSTNFAALQFIQQAATATLNIAYYTGQ